MGSDTCNTKAGIIRSHSSEGSRSRTTWKLAANVTIDRATLGHTVVKQGTKIDNLVQIAHNVTVGEHDIIVAQVGIAGSTTIGHHVMIGGQAGTGGSSHDRQPGDDCGAGGSEPQCGGQSDRVRCAYHAA